MVFTYFVDKTTKFIYFRFASQSALFALKEEVCSRLKNDDIRKNRAMLTGGLDEARTKRGAVALLSVRFYFLH